MKQMFNIKLKNLEIPLSIEELSILKNHIDDILNSVYGESIVYSPYTPLTYTYTTGTSTEYNIYNDTTFGNTTNITFT